MISRSQYLKGFSTIVLILALVRCIFPSVAGKNENLATNDTEVTEADSIAEDTLSVNPKKPHDGEKTKDVVARNDNLVEVKNVHPIIGVLNYNKAFPDSNDVQLASAMALGVEAVRDRDEAEQRKGELVYMAASPYYHVDPLKNSIPYLVPKAAVLLNDIGRNFFDSLYVKNVPMHKFIVTSVLRSQADLDKLKKVNFNVSENSCHLYGTTFDIGYNRYRVVYDPSKPQPRQVQDDTLKWVLSEVIRDLRQEGRCYVKYEVKQGCFHITVR